MDALCDGETVLIPGIMEHIERAGVHSGDSIAVYPPQSVTPDQKERLVDITDPDRPSLRIRGLINIQFVLYGGEIYVLEVNPRASRTVPFLSKVTGIPMAQVATRIMLGESLPYQGYRGGLWPEKGEMAVKVPVFSFAKLRSVDVTLGPEMKSTGEVMGRDRDVARALYKGLLAAGISLPKFGTVIATIGDKDKEEAVPLMRRFHQLGYRIVATRGTAEVLEGGGPPGGAGQQTEGRLTPHSGSTSGREGRSGGEYLDPRKDAGAGRIPHPAGSGGTRHRLPHLPGYGVGAAFHPGVDHPHRRTDRF